MAGIHRTADATAPAGTASVVTPSDATVLPVTRALYVGTGGNVAVSMGSDGDVVVFTNVADGTILPIQVMQVRSTSTTASGILALY